MSWKFLTEPFTESRKATLRWIAFGLLSAAAANVAAWMYWPRLDPVADPVERLLLAIQCCAGIGFVALVMLQGLWRLPDTPQAEDPLANAESRRWKINQRVYTNTVEQALIFVPIYLALAVRMQPDDAYMLPALTVLWCIGRLMFWAGYQYSLNARAIGMDWTTVTAMTTAGWFISTFF